MMPLQPRHCSLDCADPRSRPIVTRGVLEMSSATRLMSRTSPVLESGGTSTTPVDLPFVTGAVAAR